MDLILESVVEFRLMSHQVKESQFDQIIIIDTCNLSQQNSNDKVIIRFYFGKDLDI